jgi:hypothetical protein
MKNQLQLVTFEQAKKLKELGFDWDENSIYVTDKTFIGITNYTK